MDNITDITKYSLDKKAKKAKTELEAFCRFLESSRHKKKEGSLLLFTLIYQAIIGYLKESHKYDLLFLDIRQIRGFDDNPHIEFLTHYSEKKGTVFFTLSQSPYQVNVGEDKTKEILEFMVRVTMETILVAKGNKLLFSSLYKFLLDNSDTLFLSDLAFTVTETGAVDTLSFKVSQDKQVVEIEYRASDLIKDCIPKENFSVVN